VAAVFKTHLVVEYKCVTTNTATPAYFVIQPPQPQHSFTHSCVFRVMPQMRAETHVRLQEQWSLKLPDLNKTRNELRALAKIYSINDFRVNPDRRWV